MSPEQIAQEIAELNRHYLVLAQRLLTDDPATGAFRLHLEPAAAAAIAALDTRQILHLADTRQLLMRLALDDPASLQAVTQIDEQTANKVGTSHAALVLAGRG